MQGGGKKKVKPRHKFENPRVLRATPRHNNSAVTSLIDSIRFDSIGFKNAVSGIVDCRVSQSVSRLIDRRYHIMKEGDDDHDDHHDT